MKLQTQTLHFIKYAYKILEIVLLKKIHFINSIVHVLYSVASNRTAINISTLISPYMARKSITDTK